MELRERVGVLDRHFRRERPRLHVSPFLQLKQIPAVAEHRTFGEAFEDAFGHSEHRPSGRGSPDGIPTAPTARATT